MPEVLSDTEQQCVYLKKKYYHTEDILLSPRKRFICVTSSSPNNSVIIKPMYVHQKYGPADIFCSISLSNGL